MIDRLRLLEVLASIFVSITIMDLSLNMNDNLQLFIKKYNTVGLKLFGLWLCNVGCASIFYFAFHYVLKITNRGYIDPKGIVFIYIYI